MESAVSFDQSCPVAMSLGALANRWSLLLMRDLLWGGPQTRQGLIAGNPGLIHQLAEPEATLTMPGGCLAALIAATATTEDLHTHGGTSRHRPWPSQINRIPLSWMR
jgi:hypothetical protein